MPACSCCDQADCHTDSTGRIIVWCGNSSASQSVTLLDTHPACLPALQVLTLYLPMINGELLRDQLLQLLGSHGAPAKDVNGLCFMRGRLMIMSPLVKAHLPYMSAVYGTYISRGKGRLGYLEDRLFHLIFFDKCEDGVVGGTSRAAAGTSTRHGGLLPCMLQHKSAV
jgi:hypothetical protein